MSVGPQDAFSLPTGWSIIRLSEIGSFKSGSGFPLVYQGHSSGDFPFFKVSDFNNKGNERTLHRANHYINEPVRKKLGARLFPKGAIAFAKIGAAIFLERKRVVDQPSCLDNNMAAFIVSDPRFSRKLILANLRMISLGSLISSTALPAISSADLKAISVALPDDPKEQEAIAEALSDTDALIEGLERLIAKKRLIKQGAMQDLLTAGRRLPGFSGEWHRYRLRERGQFFKGSGIKKDEAGSGFIPCVRYGELYTLHQDVVRCFASFISPEVARTARRVQNGDILFAGSGETKEEIGKCAVVVSDGEVYAGGDIIVFRPTGDDPLFLSYLLNGPEAQRQKARKGQGDAVVHISATALGDLRVHIPNVDEQRTISTLLEDLDAEIQALENRLEKARQVKEGMMQNLLTGRIRLV